MRTFRIIDGDVLDRLRDLDAGSVRCCVTSPPYWGLRDYGHAGMGRLIEYHQTGAPYRRQRAKALVELRRAFLFNRYRGMGKRVHEITRYRRAEKLDRSLSTMASEHSEGRVGPVSIQQNEVAV